MTPEQAAFISAIIANPADDTVRLVYADYLEEQCIDLSRTHAAWIREQIADTASTRDEFNLWAALVLLGEHPEQIGIKMLEGGCVIRRGLIESVSLPLDRFMAVAKKLFKIQPVTRVVITDRIPDQQTATTWYWLAIRDDAQPPGSAWLPSILRHHLKNARNKKQLHTGRSRYHRFSYRTRELANADLGAACVSWARWVAGCPKFPPPPAVDDGGDDSEANPIFAGQAT